MILVYLNGSIVPRDQVSGADGISITYTLMDDADDNQTAAVSAEMEFRGEAFDLIKATCIDPADGKLRSVPIKLFEDCVEPMHLLLDGVIGGDLVNWCDGDCFLSARAVERTVATAALDCIRSTMIDDNRNGFQSQAHPRMVYCDEVRPDWMHHVLMCCGVIIMLIMLILIPVVLVVNGIIIVINAIIDGVNLIPGVDIDHIDADGDESTQLIDEYNNYRARLLSNIVGCGRKHPSPLVRSYVGNVCTICGLTFQSSIFTNPASDYYNTVYWSAPSRKGTKNDADLWIAENTPYRTGAMLLDELGGVFNARRRIIGNVLHFERIDLLPTSGTWIDPAVIKNEGRMVKGVCYKWSTDDLPAYADLGFQEDVSDGVGNEARSFYRRIFEWNQPVNPAQKGVKQEAWKYGMLRCRRDGVGGDVLDDYRILELADIINSYGDAMMLQKGMGYLPKLIVWNGDIVNGKVKKWNIPGYVKLPHENYNFPFHVNTFNVAANTGYTPTTPNMGIYGRFHAIRNPKVLNTRGNDFDFTFEYTGAELTSMNLFAGVPLGYGTGKIRRVTVNPDQRTILVAGTV